MSNVTYIHAQPKQGDQTFFVCGCNPEDPQAFLPIVLIQHPPLIVGLMCPECEQRLDVVNGFVQDVPKVPA
jgi:hypothetical protein